MTRKELEAAWRAAQMGVAEALRKGAGREAAAQWAAEYGARTCGGAHIEAVLACVDLERLARLLEG